MKYFILLLFCFNSAYADELCKNVMNNSYIFNYSIKNGEFEYTIKEKNNKLIHFFENSNNFYPAEIGINIENSQNYLFKFKSFLFDSVLSSSNNQADKNWRNFFYEKGELYSSNMFRDRMNTKLNMPLQENVFIDKKVITNKINIDNFLNFIKEKIPDNDKNGEKIITFKVKIILDYNSTSCIVFKAEPIKYKFG